MKYIINKKHFDFIKEDYSKIFVSRELTLQLKKSLKLFPVKKYGYTLFLEQNLEFVNNDKLFLPGIESEYTQIGFSKLECQILSSKYCWKKIIYIIKHFLYLIFHSKKI